MTTISVLLVEMIENIIFGFLKAKQRKEIEKKIEVKEIEEKTKIKTEKSKLFKERRIQQNKIHIIEQKLQMVEEV